MYIQDRDENEEKGAHVSEITTLCEVLQPLLRHRDKDIRMRRLSAKNARKKDALSRVVVEGAQKAETCPALALRDSGNFKGISIFREVKDKD